MNAEPLDLDQVKKDYLALSESFKTVLLSTVSPEGMPEASYAPYVREHGQYYVYVSELAAHTLNMSHTPRAGLLFIEDETKAAHLFARKRVTFQCSAHEIERGGEQFELIMNRFQEKFGPFMNLLRNLQDFHLFCLRPRKGSFVQGFARAFAIEGEHMDQIRHLRDRGHQAAAPANEANER